MKLDSFFKTVSKTVKISVISLLQTVGRLIRLIRHYPFRSALIILTATMILSFSLVFLTESGIRKSSARYIFSGISEIHPSQTALVPGAMVYRNGNLSQVLEDRVLTALELYRSKKVSKILVSGDHGTVEYDEVNAMKNYLLKEGVHETDLFLDHAGFDTYDSIYRAKAVFQVESLVIVTQDFHLARSVYIAKCLGIPVQGLKADRQIYLYRDHYRRRERLALIKAVIDCVIKSRPRFLGETIPITGDSKKSWD